MITNHKLQEIISEPLSKQEVAELVETCTGDIEALYHLSFHTDRETAFRAAWVLEGMAVQYPDCFGGIAGMFLAELPAQKNRSCQRHYTKILMLMTAKKAPAVYREALARADREQVVGAVFDWLIDRETPVAVAANCLDILLYFTKEFDWIGEELVQQILMRLNQGSPALDSRGRRILEILRRR